MSRKVISRLIIIDALTANDTFKRMQPSKISPETDFILLIKTDEKNPIIDPNSLRRIDTLKETYCFKEESFAFVGTDENSLRYAFSAYIDSNFELTGERKVYFVNAKDLYRMLKDCISAEKASVESVEGFDKIPQGGVREMYKKMSGIYEDSSFSEEGVPKETNEKKETASSGSESESRQKDQGAADEHAPKTSEKNPEQSKLFGGRNNKRNEQKEYLKNNPNPKGCKNETKNSSEKTEEYKHSQDKKDRPKIWDDSRSTTKNSKSKNTESKDKKNNNVNGGDGLDLDPVMGVTDINEDAKKKARTSGKSLKALEKKLFAETKIEEYEEDFTELDESKVKLVMDLFERLKTHFKLIVEPDAEFSDDKCENLLIQILKSPNYEDFKKSVDSANIGIPVKMSCELFPSYKKEAEYYSEVCNMLYKKDRWDSD